MSAASGGLVDLIGRVGIASRRVAETALGQGASDQLWVTVADEALSLLGAEGVLCFETLQSERMFVRAAPGCPSLLVADAIAIAPDSQAAYVLGSDEPVVVSDLLTESRFVAGEMLVRLGFRSSVSCRVGGQLGRHDRDDALGLIGAYSRAADRFDAADGSVLQALAATVAVGLIQQRRTTVLQHRAFHDELTGLANRASVLASLEAVGSRMSARSSRAVLMIDLDGFKRVNDSYGHHVGDEVLRQVAQRLTSSVPPTGLVGRLGGDEFLVLVDGLGMDQVRRLAERIVGSLEQVMTVDDLTIEMSASVGVASYRDATNVTGLLQIADRAMYKAKATGRGCVVTATRQTPMLAHSDPAEPSKVCATGFDLAGIDAAIAQIRVVFQPIVRSGSHEIIGVEALTRGPIGTALEPPDRLFGVAETFGRLVELEIAAKRASFACELPDGVAFFVNIDPAVIVDDDALASIIDAWISAGARQPIIVELTERALVTSPGRLLRAVDRCRELGWAIALDDIGARAESLTALRIVRPDLLKLDMQLLQGSNRGQASAIAASLASYCERFGVDVVAEGVEHAGHEETAELLGATLLQGFRFGRPGALTDFALSTPRSPARVARLAVPRLRAMEPGDRVATKSQLVDFSRHIETLGSAADTVILTALQDIKHLTPRTRRQYAALARRFGLVGVVGAGLVPGVVDGVKHAVIPPGDGLLRCWDVVLVSGHNSIALLAEELDGELRPDRERLFRYRFVTSTDEVEAAAHRLLAYF